ncbi:hypothetical protein C9J03_26115 [Photobacterium gaetbulicola]|uniref:JAB domain-containing protein n=1 Tax=Photobacterium gaetbulicola Gung47 TaxID=658445 RepID=A0A0C4JN04_9GAMM|nr:hypothetical protein [Photobacterium gaetbulicola]AHA59174.1 hypothetical protein H744_p0025 [Photobacterium gaetbulicola Gung47]PST98683.1 hypothetical protein C9J03_26115 [Photobacterium gaetbulicola]
MTTAIFIEDAVLPQLFTSAIEAYEIEHKATHRSRAKDRIETFGLLWGHIIPEKGDKPARCVITTATIETSAVRDYESVDPNFESIQKKKAFFERYWPNLELIGTFHSHPYDSLDEVNSEIGWRASEEDEEFFPYIHEVIAPEQDEMVHLILTITELQRNGWAFPSRLANNEESKGFVLSAERRKLWLRAYASSHAEDNGEAYYYHHDDVHLQAPSLECRFFEN